jgi:hypothetical protein
MEPTAGSSGESMAKKKHLVPLTVIPEPAEGTRAVLLYTGEGTIVMRGQADTLMTCGACGVPLIDGVLRANIRDVVVKCPACGEFNETLPG